MATDLHIIWDQVRQGDIDAWSELVNRYARLVYSVATKAGLPDQDAEDCAQQTWLTLYRKRSSINDPVALPAWLIRTTHREAVRMARRYQSTLQVEPSTATIADEQLPDSQIIQMELRTAIELALTELDPRCRKLVRALYLSDQTPSYKSLSRSLGIKPNSLGPLRSRCLQRLKKILRKNGYPVD